MSPLYSLQKTRAELEHALSNESNPATRSALRLAIDSTVRQITSHISRHHASVMRVDRQLSSFNGQKRIQVGTAKIKCSMKDLSAARSAAWQEDHWFWSKEEANESARFGKIQIEMQEVFQALPDKPLIRLTYLLGGVKKLLKETGFENILTLPLPTRKQHGPVLLEVIKKAVMKEK